MKIHYDREDDILDVDTETPDAVSESLVYDPHVVVSLATEDSYDIVRLEIMWASSYIRSGYDAETDTLRIGRTVCDPELITENGDMVGYWQKDEYDPEGFRVPIGVAIRRASVHLSKVSEKMSANLVSAD